MEERIVEFAGLLRRHGIRVSTAETLDALRVAEISGIGDRPTFRSALAAAMVKRPGDVDAYGRLFDLFFSGISQLVEETGQGGEGALDPEALQDLLDSLAERLEGMEPGVSELTRALLLQDHGALETILRELLESGEMPELTSNYIPPEAGRQMLEMLGGGALAGDIDRILGDAEGSGMPEEDVERLRDYLEERMNALREMLKGLLRLDREQAREDEERKDDRDRLLDKSFYYLSPSELKKMREAVAALARKLKNIMAIRYKRAKRGRLDVKATLRHSMEFGGVPFRIRYDDRRRERPQIVILCDVSDSVRNVSRFMLQFVHSLQDLYSRVRSYVFVADIAEVTQLFKDNDTQTALGKSINGDVVNVYAHSDFGRAFRQFHRDHLDVVDSRTTVIILGDARNNYNAPNDWVLRDVSERARQVIWLNPENRSTWGFGDSEMTLYGSHCTFVEECRNLRQLYRVVDLLVAG